MAEKAPCRWLKSRISADDNGDPTCRHPVVDHLTDGLCFPECHGCPCHEPEPAKGTAQKGDGDAVATD